MDEVTFRSDEGPSEERMTIGHAGNQDWYITMYPSEEALERRQLPHAFRVCTSGSQLPQALVFITAILWDIGRGDYKEAVYRCETLLRVLREAASHRREHVKKQQEEEAAS